MKPYVLLDFDGTLIDSMGSIMLGVTTVFRRSGIVPYSLQDYILNFSFPFMNYYKDRGVKVDHEQIFEWYKIGATPFRDDFFIDALDLLFRLESAGYVPAIVSSNSEENIQRSLRRHGLVRIEAHSVHAADKTECIKQLVQSSDFGSGTLYVGDIVSDMVQAKNAGARPVGIIRNYFSSLAPKFFEAGATDCISTLKALQVA